jgi:glycosyltransferase involved in cell wall biosynthesis
VVTIHDLSFLHDYAFPGRKGWERMVPWSVRRAAKVIVPTEAVATEVAERFDLAGERIAVTHEGVAPVFFGATPLSEHVLAEMGIGRPFAIAAGTIEPRKNLARLLEAWSSVGPGSGWTLVVAGPKGWGPGLPKTPGVVTTGWVGDETLPGLLAAADLFCYPSLYEGFGLPPLEAMAAGTACLVGDYSAAEEVVADAAVRVDPLDVGAIAEALEALMGDDSHRRALAVTGKARAAGFTWEGNAAATIDVYRSVIEGPKKP